MTKPHDLLALAQAAIHYAQTVAHTQHCKEMLRGGYITWRSSTGNQHTHLTRGDANWQAMMSATVAQYLNFRNAKSRQYRAHKKLLALAKQWEGVQ
ncbi:hypothetical protein [Acidovorax temperans]|uniref:hypothetical protein n=1 Tax=Acidovorax temperans TaxID=80878 RepID=UPI0035B1F38E